MCLAFKLQKQLKMGSKYPLNPLRVEKILSKYGDIKQSATTTGFFEKKDRKFDVILNDS